MGKKRLHFVYLTTNKISGKEYIGDHSTKNIKDSYLGSGIALKDAIIKYGKENFKREILELFETKEEAFNAQEKYINEYNTLVPNGYNISPTGGNEITGGAVSNDTKIKMSIAKTGIKFTEDHKNNLKRSHIGLKQSKETIQKRISKTKGKKRSQEFKDRLKKPKSEETKRKIRESMIGIKHTEERRRNQSISQKNRWKDPLERGEQSKRLRGIKCKKETKEKISNSLKGRKLEIIKCPHCGKEGPKPQMFQWHMDKCKK